MKPLKRIPRPTPFEWYRQLLEQHHEAMERKLERIHEEYLNDNL